MSEPRPQPTARPWRPLPILEFWGRVTIALDQEPYQQRHFPGGCRVNCWDLGGASVRGAGARKDLLSVPELRTLSLAIQSRLT